MRNSGKKYVTGRGVKVGPKVFQPIENHQCRYACSNFTTEKLESIFNTFYELGSWDLQTAFITSCIESSTPKRRSVGSTKEKRLSTSIKLKGKRVCKLFFLKTLSISGKRFDNIVKKLNETKIAHTD